MASTSNWVVGGGIISKHSSDFGDAEELGFQAEKYFTNFTLRAEFGYQSYDREAIYFRENQNPSLDAVASLGVLSEKDHFGSVKGSWYLTNDFVAYAALERNIGRSGDSRVGFEWQIGTTDHMGYSLHSEVQEIDGHGSQFLVGLRVYFDGRKSLKLRHRIADPEPSYDGFGQPYCPAAYVLTGGVFSSYYTCVPRSSIGNWDNNNGPLP